MLTPPPRPILWLVACMLCVACGFVLGRQTRHPSAEPAAVSVTVAPESGAQPASSNPAAQPSPASTAERRRALEPLLQCFDANIENQDFAFGTLMDLAAWTGTATEAELTEALAMMGHIVSGEASARTFPLVVFDRWASLDGAAAFNACLERTSDPGLLRTILQSWVRNGDAGTAIEHALALRRSDPDKGSSPLVGDLLMLWKQRDPAAAEACARRLATAEDPQEREASRPLAADLARASFRAGGVDAALQLIATWPDPDANDALLLSLFADFHRAPGDALDSAARILSRIQDPRLVAEHDAFAELSGSIDHLLRNQDDARRLRDWCLGLPPQIQPLAINQIATQLARRDQWRDTLAWLQSHPAPPATYAEAYDQAASAAAKDGEMACALSLPGQTGSDTWPENRRSRLLQDWIEGDPTRGELLLGFIVATESAERSGSLP